MKFIGTTVIAVMMTTSAWAQSDATKQEPSTMPMTQHGSGKMMMDPQMMEKMMNSGGSAEMRMMDMQIMHRMMHQMEDMEHDLDCGHRQNHDKSMMGGGMGKMMMNPQMMQMRMQHMTNMEQRLKNIESLLSQLVELQKAR
jgi:hypothetical protein